MRKNRYMIAALLAAPLAASSAWAVSFEAGLTSGILAGDINTAAPNPANRGQQLGIDAGQTNGSPWAGNRTFVYTGQVFDADGIFSFAENIDDKVRIKINGIDVLSNDVYNQPTTTGSATNNSAAGAGTLNFGMGPAGDGWHDIEIRMSNGAGGAGAVAGNGWTTSFGFGLNTAGSTSNQGTNYVAPVDPGDATLFRTLHADPFGPGLVQGYLPGNISTAPNPNIDKPLTTEVFLRPELAYTNQIPPWAANQTVVYSGYFFDADGVFSFGESIDDKVRLFIDDQLVLSHDTWNVPSATGILDMGRGGWFKFDLYMSDGGGGAGAQAFNGWSNTFGFGYNPNGTTSTNGADFIPLVDPGDGSLLRVAILPEPGTVALLGLSLTGLLARRRREC